MIGEPPEEEEREAAECPQAGAVPSHALHTSSTLLPTAPDTHSHSLDWSFPVGWQANSTIGEEEGSAHIRVLLVTLAKLTARSNTGRTRWHDLTNLETDIQTSTDSPREKN